MNETLTLIPLGGVGEIGKNMLAVQCQGKILVIDAGLSFPDEQLLGVDVVVPDTSWLVENQSNVVGVCLTHGHEDHIGGLPYLMMNMDVPVWGTKLTLGLVKSKLEERKLSTSSLVEVEAGDFVDAGPFEIEFVQVAHSIPDACSIAVRTPAGTIVHTSDFKFDHNPVDGRLTDLARFAEIGREGVLVLTSDSTNIEREGYSPSESVLSKTFDRIFAEAEGRVIAASFASNLHRVQQIADTSIKYNRQLAVVGRSMEQNVATARALGYLQIPDWALISIDDIGSRPVNEITIMCTGSQGEPLSVLSRLSTDDHNKLEIFEGDTVVISATPIPGNENLVHRVINNLFKRGANVVYDSIEPVHVSGHAYKEELRMVLQLINPRWVVPVHGEHRHLSRYREMAIESGYRSQDIFRLEIGDILELTEETAELKGKLEQAGNVMVDGLGIGDVGDVTLRDRRHLANDGVLIVVVSVDSGTGELLAGPDLIARGFMDASDDFLTEARDLIISNFQSMASDAARDVNTAKSDIRGWVGKLVNSRTRRRPVIIPIVMEV